MIDQAINPAPMGLDSLMEEGPDIEIQIENPEGLQIGMDGMVIDLMPEDEEEGFDDNLA
jgi:hypothetical protein